MAVKINLLPPESTVSGPLAKILKITRTLNVIFLGAFIIFALGLAGLFIFSTLQLQSLTSTQNQIKSQISAQETSEQKLVLLKDRLGKIQIVKGVTSSLKSINDVDPFVDLLVGSSTLIELDVDSQKTDLSVLFKTNTDLSSFVKSMTDSKVFKSVILSSFGFNPASGYLVSLHII